jgi:5-methylcytosine-specific restriction endonuclease McrA
MEGKTCSKCGVWKPYSEFHKAKQNPDGYKGQCKICRLDWHRQNAEREKARMLRAYYANREERNAKRSEWAKQNREHVREVERRYWNKNRDKKRAKDVRYYQRHKPEHMRYSRQWKRNNPDKVRIIELRRRARKERCGGTHTLPEWKALCNQYGNKCLSCGNTGRLTVDHVIPLSKGGTNDIGNLQPLCLSCNIRKNTRIIDYREYHWEQDRLPDF